MKTPLRRGILFDIDGVLIDVRKSYIDSIRRTVQLYLEQITGVSPSRKVQLLSREDVDTFKLLGGFNNDWDCVYGLLVYFQSLIGSQKLRVSSINLLKKKRDLSSLLKKLPRPCGIKGIRPLVKHASQIDYELAKEMFQEIYLGEKLFRKLYRRPPRFSRVSGLNLLERPLIPASLLKTLGQKFTLGIVTGRTRFEAEHVLNRFKIFGLFKSMVTYDEVARAEKRTGQVLRKPHPYSVLECAEQLQCGKYLYVGDLPDDVRAATHSKNKISILSAGFVYKCLSPKHTVKEMKKAEADFILRHPKELRKAEALLS